MWGPPGGAGLGKDLLHPCPPLCLGGAVQAWNENVLCPGGQPTFMCKSAACQPCSRGMRKRSLGTCGFGETGCVSLVCRFGQAREWSRTLTPAPLSCTLTGLLCGHLLTRFWGYITGMLT